MLQSSLIGHPMFGDRKIELVFIGQMLNVDKITEELDKCLLNTEELDKWKNDKFKKEDSWPIQFSLKL